MSERPQEGGAPAPGRGLLSLEELAPRVHQSLRPKRREAIPLERVEEILAGLQLGATKPARSAPRLRIHRLAFTGAIPSVRPINYDHVFAPGVNVLLIPDNGAGKSSILKTIKFALTGDDGDYDRDVRDWIHDVWLDFYIDDSEYTVHLSKGEGGLRGYIASAHIRAAADETSRVPHLVQRMRGVDDVQSALQAFFFRHFDLSELSWTQPAGTGRAVRSTSWLTFFQGLVIPGNSEHYLLVDTEHGIGGQQGLILSMLLGLSYASPLNQLMIQSKLAEAETNVTDEQREKAEGDVAALNRELEEVQSGLRAVEAAQRRRRREYEENPTTERLMTLRGEQVAKTEEMELLDAHRRQLNTEIQRQRAQSRSLREAIALRLHFTGIQVSLCPNCDNDVEPTEVERERTHHLCRLCGKEPHTASADDLAAMGAAADELDADSERKVGLRDSAGAEHQRARNQMTALQTQVSALNVMLRKGVEYVLPTPEEEEERSKLDRRVGAIRASLVLAQKIIAEHQAGLDDVAVRIEIQKKARALLQQEAERLNEEGLSHLAGLTEAMAHRFGAESISDLKCSALGHLSLQKNGVQVTWKSIQNAGDRLRVKMAFFLAMMRLGRIEHAGKHPGFLMIDQPGSDEMVVEDFLSLARVLREIDTDYADQLQIFCFTARPEFADATVPEKVYGPTVGNKAF